VLGKKKSFYFWSLCSLASLFSVVKKLCLSFNVMRWNCFKLSIICSRMVTEACLLIRTENEYSSEDLLIRVMSFVKYESSNLVDMTLYWIFDENFSLISIFLSAFQIKYYSLQMYLKRLLVLANLMLLIVFMPPIFLSMQYEYYHTWYIIVYLTLAWCRSAIWFAEWNEMLDLPPFVMVICLQHQALLISKIT
jgi:hypothetical protein